MANVCTLNKQFVYDQIPLRNPETHKGDYGKILLLCGSRSYTGAAALASLGALRSGVGLVYLGVPNSIYTIEASKLLEPVIISLEEVNGIVASSAVESIAALLPKMDAVLIGCGLGQSEGALAVLNYILQRYHGPVVVDADGINLLAAHISILRGRTAPTVLTPHDGEFLRLGGDGNMDRIEAAVKLAKDLGCIVLRKGHTSVITDGTDTYLNCTGNAGMATGGSGDVLAGIVVSLIGQGIPPLEASACAAWLHGTSGDICAEQIGQYGMLPQDMLNVLPRLLP